MDIKNKRLLLVGGAGLIGSHIVDLLVNEPVQEIIVYDNFVRGRHDNLQEALRSSKVKVVQGSMLDRDALRCTMGGVQGVFLLASLWLGECLQDPRAAWETNVMGSWNVVEACRDLGVERLVYSSSASVYGNALEIPMTEIHPFNNRTTYGATKIAIEQMLRAVHDQVGLPYVGLRYMNIFGPRMDYQGAYVSVIMKVLDRIFAGQPPLVYGDGSQTYDFIYVEDAARANVLAMQADCVDEQFNIGRGLGTTITKLVGLLLDLTGSRLAPQFLPQEQSLVTHRIGSVEKASRQIGFEAQTPLVEGLRRVVAWRQAQRP